MIDEKVLADRLADAATAQDNLLPRALSDDLAAGRRRLRRHRVLTGSGVIGGAVAVAALIVGVTSSLSPNADPLPGDPPVASANAGKTLDEYPDAFLDAKMRGLVGKHFDPAKKHLTFETGPFEFDRQPGQRMISGRAGWKIAGQKGEGMVYVALYGSTAGNRCGDYNSLQSSCHSTPMPGGRTATIGRSGEKVEISYQQPDGETAYVAVSPVFANNTTVAVSGMGITDAQLKAFVADSTLNLPSMKAEEEAAQRRLLQYAPSVGEVKALAVRSLPGGEVYTTRIVDDAGSYLNRLSWKKGAISATVWVGVDAKLTASRCQDQLSVPNCTPLTLPDGKKVGFFEGARTYPEGPEYVMGATYTQPDGDLASVRILYPGEKLPGGAVTKEQLLAMVTDPVLDK
ncbi:hypothetical protein [Streptomyces sp. SID13031]|uniref:hypothetical protein n=1 Tax=Streptomyces sp. SID13031 TaxID=2706046 RepID=UPI0013CB5079|nr:hypothetical protein [Streptomyces sp. SID13031]NEA30999.1 hypothetical protein [Streptomyces sp. SID13031]